MVELANIKNAAILQDFLNFWSWQHQKWRNSARLPSKMESWLQSERPRANAFGDSPSPCLWSMRLPRKSDARSYKALHLSHKIIFPKLKIWCSKMQPPLGNQRPDFLTSLMNMSLVLRLPQKMHLSRSSSMSLLKLLQKPHVLFIFDKVHNPLRLQRKTTSERPKVVWTRGVFNTLTWTCASRHNGVQFFISHLSTWPRTRRFREPTFRPSKPQNIGKNRVFRGFATFSRTCVFFFFFFSLFLFSDRVSSSLLWLFPPLLFHLSMPLEVWLLHFLRQPYVQLFHGASTRRKIEHDVSRLGQECRGLGPHCPPKNAVAKPQLKLKLPKCSCASGPQGITRQAETSGDKRRRRQAETR